jgi:Photosynthetic reaction centre cytochrome C subunit
MRTTWPSALILGAVSLAITANAPSSEPASPVKPTNLKVLPPNSTAADVQGLMEQYGDELGVTCEYCHTHKGGTQALDYASDDNPAKQTARVMIAMLNEINTRYLAQLDDQKYAVLVSCGNCHRGHADPPEFAPAAAVVAGSPRGRTGASGE